MGANVNAERVIDGRAFTPFMLAALLEDFEMMQLLVEKGAELPTRIMSFLAVKSLWM